MAGLEMLEDLIYFEKQQPGSMLCAQHALNSLLQGNYFTAPDLAQIAESFDALEQGTLDEASRNNRSTNMDDTGFFSVQVMDRALEVWGLNLVRWRREEMRPYNSAPHKQLAFVLNLHQHWLTLRRFGPARPDFKEDPGEGHWFNLNSASMKPHWISKTYLGMVLQQMEQEGYSVFAVVQDDPTQPNVALPRTDADIIAASLSAPDSGSGSGLVNDPASTTPAAAPTPSDKNTPDENVIIPDDTEELEDNDMELQAALQASLTGGDYAFAWDSDNPNPHPLQHPAAGNRPFVPTVAPALREAPPPPPALGLPTGPRRGMEGEGIDADPVAASMARNSAMLEQMRRAQEEALRENYEDEMAGYGTAGAGGVGGVRRTRGDEEEAEELRRVMAASMGGVEVPSATGEEDDEEIGEDKENVGRRRPARPPGLSGSGTNVGASGLAQQQRVYDDEDAELQAALRASLEGMPADYMPPATPPRRQASLPQTQPATTSSATGQTSAEVLHDEKEKDEDERSVMSSPPPPAPLDMEEVRRRRLAKFGG